MPSPRPSKTTSDLPSNLGAPALRALQAAGLTRLAQLSRLRREELEAVHGVGPRALTRICEALAERGLSLKGESSREDAAVAQLIEELKHPLKREVSALRALILGVAPEVREEVKWRSPSFRTTEHFATINLHARDRIRLILHTGAKGSASMRAVADPAGLLEWLGKDRGMVTLRDGKELAARRAPLRALLRAWVGRLAG